VIESIKFVGFTEIDSLSEFISFIDFFKLVY
jgi:hypothetical protein